jgi:hypothetical protein
MTYINMPDALLDVIRAWSSTNFRSISSYKLAPLAEIRDTLFTLKAQDLRDLAGRPRLLEKRYQRRPSIGNKWR